MYYLLAKREKWDLFFDIWPAYDHCQKPSSLVTNSQCRPRVWGYKEDINHLNPKYNFFYIVYTIYFELQMFRFCFLAMRDLRAQEAKISEYKRLRNKAVDEKKDK